MKGLYARGPNLHIGLGQAENRPPMQDMAMLVPPNTEVPGGVLLSEGQAQLACR